MAIEASTKKCAACGGNYPKTPEYFHWANRSKGYFQSTCKGCRYVIRKKRREENPRKYRADRKRRRERNIEKYRATEKAYHRNNLEKRRAAASRWRKKNIEKARAAARLWYRENAARRLAYNRDWHRNNPEKISRINARRRATPRGRINHSVAACMWRSLKRNKGGQHWETLVGYTLKDLMRHLEKQFRPGMTWDNYGEWHIDHRIPVAAFNFTKPEHRDFRRCWSLKNLQPMWARDNILKRANLKKHFQPSLAL